MSELKLITLKINGQEESLKAASNMTLLEALRELHHFEVKCGCEKGDCGACAVLVDGEAVDTCLMLSWSAQGREITTLAGLSDGENLHPLQKAFIEKGGVQCGYCTPGMIMASKSMLDKNPNPSMDDMRVGLSGNLCRCTGYTKIFEAVDCAATEIRDGGGE
ncbi:MAG: (2Fe-2S)-binding protein [Amphritea sp.]